MKIKRVKLKGHLHVSGFTLLELLIVIVIIGIILTFATLSIHQAGPAAQMAETSQRLAAVLTLASQEAILQGQEIGIYFNKTSYQFYRLEMEKWQMQQEDIMRPYFFQGCIEAQLQVEGENVTLDTAKKIPQVVLFSSGEITPFKLTLICTVDEQYRYQVVGMANGSIKITP